MIALKFAVILFSVAEMIGGTYSSSFHEGGSWSIAAIFLLIFPTSFKSVVNGG
jgi:hypothetical protein